MSDLHEIIRANVLSQRLNPPRTSFRKSLAFMDCPNKRAWINEMSEEEWGQIAFQAAYNFMEQTSDDPDAQEGVRQMTEAWADGLLVHNGRMYLKPSERAVARLIDEKVIMAEYPVEVVRSGEEVIRGEKISEITIPGINGENLIFRRSYSLRDEIEGHPTLELLFFDGVWGPREDSTRFFIRPRFEDNKCRTGSDVFHGELGPFGPEYPPYILLGQFLRDVKTAIDAYIVEHVRGEE